tara:strand:+ start:30771 stop:31070 length:300 start_codon:yes stop_codon:yes gene_type:complete
VLEFFLILSLILNIILGWYIVQLLRRFLGVSEGLDEFFEVLEEYSDHLEIVNKMESYHGDVTLQNLVRHSKNIIQHSQEIRALYDIDYVPQEEEDENIE